MLKIYNTLSGKKESFRKKTITLYTCGPTVYDYDHLGHAWNYFNSDILRRTLEYNNYKVKHVMNITDVGHLVSDADTGQDKMEKSAKEKKKSIWKIAEYFTKIFFENRKKLNILYPHIVSRATDCIKETQDLIKILIKKGYAYKISDGIYFNVQKFPKYGKLSGNTLEKLKAGARIDINLEKKHPADFALWKFSPKNEKRQMEWDSPWGKGFPGWHMECSTIAMKYLGKTIDIHTGGEDNIFPHHESEIAQSEAINKKRFVRIWFHTRHLKIEGQKMSKSLKNFITLREIKNPLALRYLFLTAHYRTPFNYTEKGLKAAESALKSLYNFFLSLEDSKRINKKYQKQFQTAINDDLNMPKAMSIVWKLIKDQKAKDKKQTLLNFDKVLGLGLKELKIIIPEKIRKLIKERETQRKEKNWEKADKLRNQIEKQGFLIKDTEKGTNISFA
ncbi:MAG: cysteine--tRNA ligase [Candidatus Pacebacteria bacterium]|nr:cysteine--tRNA ligase [Candidatus Paceibacterota bacterium]